MRIDEHKKIKWKNRQQQKVEKNSSDIINCIVEKNRDYKNDSIHFTCRALYSVCLISS